MLWDLTNVQSLEDVARYFKMLYNVDSIMLLLKIVSLIAMTCSRILEPFLSFNLFVLTSAFYFILCLCTVYVIVFQKSLIICLRNRQWLCATN
jgi:hypothetical protein